MAEYVYQRGITLTDPQEQIFQAFDNGKRFVVVCAGRRVGKSTCSIQWLFEEALRNPGELCLYVAPSYRMAYDIGWQMLMDTVPEELIKKRSQRDLTITLVNGARIACKGSDNTDGLRGIRVAALVLEEAAFQKPRVWEEVLSATTADLQAPVLFISTPRHGWFMNLVKYAASGKDKQWAHFKFTIYDSLLAHEEIERIKSRSSEMTWQQEYMANPQEYSGAVFEEFNAQESVVAEDLIPFDAIGYPCVPGLDWGHSDDTACEYLHIDKRGHMWFLEEHVRNGWDAGKHAEVLKNRGRGRKLALNTYILDRSTFRKIGESSVSIAQQFRQAGIPVQPSVKDKDIGIDILKRYMRGDGNGTWFHVSNRCQNLIKGLRDAEHGKHEPDAVAAARYAATMAVMRKITRLVEEFGLMPPAKEIKAPNLEDRIPRELLSKKKRWSNDEYSGAPNLNGFIR